MQCLCLMCEECEWSGLERPHSRAQAKQPGSFGISELTPIYIRGKDGKHSLFETYEFILRIGT